MGTVSRRDFLKKGAVGLVTVSGAVSGFDWLSRLAAAAPNLDVQQMTNQQYVGYCVSQTDLRDCSQVVVSKHALVRGWDYDQLVAASQGFGTGMFQTLQCGAATGAYMVLGLHAHSIFEEYTPARDWTVAALARFNEHFLERNASLTCLELLGLDLTTSEGRTAWMERGLGQTVCFPAMVSALDILDEITGYEQTVQ